MPNRLAALANNLPNDISLYLANEAETIKFGETLARALVAGDIVLLNGLFHENLT